MTWIAGDLPDVADVQLVGHPEQLDARAPDGARAAVERLGHPLDHVTRHAPLTCPASSMKRLWKPLCRATPRSRHISANSLTSPMLTARNVFFSSFTISATRGDETDATVSTTSP